MVERKDFRRLLPECSIWTLPLERLAIPCPAAAERAAVIDDFGAPFLVTGFVVGDPA